MRRSCFVLLLWCATVSPSSSHDTSPRSHARVERHPLEDLVRTYVNNTQIRDGNLGTRELDIRSERACTDITSGALLTYTLLKNPALNQRQYHLTSYTTSSHSEKASTTSWTQKVLGCQWRLHADSTKRVSYESYIREVSAFLTGIGLLRGMSAEKRPTSDIRMLLADWKGTFNWFFQHYHMTCGSKPEEYVGYDIPVSNLVGFSESGKGTEIIFRNPDGELSRLNMPYNAQSMCFGVDTSTHGSLCPRVFILFDEMSRKLNKSGHAVDKAAKELTRACSKLYSVVSGYLTAQPHLEKSYDDIVSSYTGRVPESVSEAFKSVIYTIADTYEQDALISQNTTVYKMYRCVLKLRAKHKASTEKCRTIDTFLDLLRHGFEHPHLAQGNELVFDRETLLLSYFFARKDELTQKHPEAYNLLSELVLLYHDLMLYRRQTFMAQYVGKHTPRSSVETERNLDNPIVTFDTVYRRAKTCLELAGCSYESSQVTVDLTCLEDTELQTYITECIKLLHTICASKQIEYYLTHAPVFDPQRYQEEWLNTSPRSDDPHLDVVSIQPFFPPVHPYGNPLSASTVDSFFVGDDQFAPSAPQEK